MLLHRPIGSIYRNIAKPLFFRFDPETVHYRISDIGMLMGRFRLTRQITAKFLGFRHPALEQDVAGLHFINPVGLSAGFDKNAELVNILPSVGFGFMEIGSVTLEAYAGNPSPRLFRLPKSKALVVYYGLMNIGVQKIAARIKQAIKSSAVVGVSVAKTNCSRTSDEAAGIADYYDCLQYLEQEEVGDYYTINVSCPNTFGGEPFTTEEKLEKLLYRISALKIQKPVFVKMPINLPIEEFDKILKVVIKYKMNGVVIGNLTKARDSKLILDPIPEHVKGGISGKPTEALCNELISYTYRNYGKQLIIIGVGGIFSAADAYQKIKLGASLLQLITGMIFQGPQLIGQINYELVKLLRADGFQNIEDAIGVHHQK